MKSKTERREEVAAWFSGLQAEIIASLEQEDGSGRFGTEEWERPGGGGGLTRLLTDGSVIEKGGVNFSKVFGPVPAPVKASFQTEAATFFATGVSIVIHPRNPYVPIIHMNVRYFELSDGQAWFGGGIDLTPAYVFEDDATEFHGSLRAVCDRFDPAWYPRFKAQADSYFTIRHRNETRGIGGIFYDRLPAADEAGFSLYWAFTRAVGEAFSPVYTRLMRRHKDQPFGEREKNWQLHRRARYVEFNLVYDAGTRFGLETNGRTESILMSMPPLARWESNFVPEIGSMEAKSQSYFSHPFSWIG